MLKEDRKDGRKGKTQGVSGGRRGKEEEEEVHQKEVLLPTVEELSEWRSPPPQRPSAQTQTGPAGRQRRGTKERRKVKNRHEGAKTPGKQNGLVTGLNSALPKSPSARRWTCSACRKQQLWRSALAGEQSPSKKNPTLVRFHELKSLF